jgi:hypothetical protein
MHDKIPNGSPIEWQAIYNDHSNTLFTI